MVPNGYLVSNSIEWVLIKNDADKEFLGIGIEPFCSNVTATPTFEHLLPNPTLSEVSLQTDSKVSSALLIRLYYTTTPISAMKKPKPNLFREYTIPLAV